MATKEDLYEAALDLFSEGSVDEAIATYKEALGVDPHYVDALCGLAMAYSSKEAYEDAIAVCKRVCEIRPDDVLAHTTLSMLFWQRGMIAEARAESATALGLLATNEPPKGNDERS